MFIANHNSNPMKRYGSPRMRFVLGLCVAFFVLSPCLYLAFLFSCTAYRFEASFASGKEVSSPDTVDTVGWYSCRGERECDPPKLTWSNFRDAMESLDHAFLYLDAPWSLDSKLGRSDSVLNRLSDALRLHEAVRDTFPNARIVHVKYHNWWPSAPEFSSWWDGQFDAPIQWGKYRSFLLHVVRGRVASGILNVYEDCKATTTAAAAAEIYGDDDANDRDAGAKAAAHCVLYLFSLDDDGNGVDATTNDESSQHNKKNWDVPYTDRTSLPLRRNAITDSFPHLVGDRAGKGRLEVAEFGLEGLDLAFRTARPREGRADEL